MQTNIVMLPAVVKRMRYFMAYSYIILLCYGFVWYKGACSRGGGGHILWFILSKIHICVSICPCNLYWLFFFFVSCFFCPSVCAYSPSCTWRGTWPCRFWDITTTSSLPPTFWISLWALRRFGRSFPLSHIMGNRCVFVHLHMGMCASICFHVCS